MVLFGKILDERYTRLLMRQADLALDDIILLVLFLTIRFVNFGTCNSGKNGYIKIRRFTPIV